MPQEKPFQSRLHASQPISVGTSKRIGPVEIQAAIMRLAHAIAERHPAAENLLLLGIANGGIELAHRIARQLAGPERRPAVKAGSLDVSFHRDDIGQHPIPKEFAPTHIPDDVNGGTIILIDDVLFSGRTIKAALDELFDHGRPAKVELAVLVDRGGRRLPLAADYVGLVLAANDQEKVVVTLDPKQPKNDAIRIEPASRPVLPEPA